MAVVVLLSVLWIGFSASPFPGIRHRVTTLADTASGCQHREVYMVATPALLLVYQLARVYCVNVTPLGLDNTNGPWSRNEN